MADTTVKAIYGNSLKCVRRPAVATDLAALAAVNMFQVQNSCILIRRMWGHVRTAFTGVATTLLINYVPAGGGGGTNFCAASAGAAHAIDVILTWSGVVAGALTPTSVLGHCAASGTATETFSGSDLICAPGNIQFTVGGGADATGMVDWYIQFWPGDLDARVVAL